MSDQDPGAPTQGVPTLDDPRPHGRPPLDLSLYLVADTGLCDERSLVATVAEAAGAGVTAVQLRATEPADEDVVRLGLALRAVLAGTGVPLLVNDRVHLVSRIGADGAHVGQDDLAPEHARALLGPDCYLGLSVRSLDELATARALAPGTVDYLGVGPVWPTATKPDHAPPGGPERVAAVAGASPWPCVAIGGIDEGRVPLLRGTGAAGVAVASALCTGTGTRPGDVAARTRGLRAAWDGRS